MKRWTIPVAVACGNSLKEHHVAGSRALVLVNNSRDVAPSHTSAFLVQALMSHPDATDEVLLAWAVAGLEVHGPNDIRSRHFNPPRENPFERLANCLDDVRRAGRREPPLNRFEWLAMSAVWQWTADSCRHFTPVIGALVDRAYEIIERHDTCAWRVLSTEPELAQQQHVEALDALASECQLRNFGQYAEVTWQQLRVKAAAEQLARRSVMRASSPETIRAVPLAGSGSGHDSTRLPDCFVDDAGGIGILHNGVRYPCEPSERQAFKVIRAMWPPVSGKYRPVKDVKTEVRSAAKKQFGRNTASDVKKILGRLKIGFTLNCTSDLKGVEIFVWRQVG